MRTGRASPQHGRGSSASHMSRPGSNAKPSRELFVSLTKLLTYQVGAAERPSSAARRPGEASRRAEPLWPACLLQRLVRRLYSPDRLETPSAILRSAVAQATALDVD